MAETKIASQSKDINIIMGVKKGDSLLLILNENLEKLIYAIGKEGFSLAQKFKEEYSRLKEETNKELNIIRLYNGQSETIATSSVPLDLISYFPRVNVHIIYIAVKLLLVPVTFLLRSFNIKVNTI